MLPNKEGAVSQVSVSPNEKFIAFSTVRGIICILEKTSHGAKHLVTTAEHQNKQITSLQWNSNNNELFVGDNTGKVSIVMVSIFPTTGMFQTPSFVLMQLDSKVVQMDFNSSMLLVSTLTKCYICDTKKEIFRQVGQKLRDGEFGACIYNTEVQEDVVDLEKTTSEVTNLEHLKLLCARPGSRIWECAIDGTVISTHHFKEALAVPPRKIYFLNDLSSQKSDFSSSIVTNGSCTYSEQINSNFSEQSFNFQKLQVLMSRFFFTYKSDGIYVFDPQRSAVVLWNNEITNIVDAKSANDVIYIWSGFAKMYALNVIPLEKFLLRLYFQKKYLLLAKLCVEFQTFLISEASHCSKLNVLQDLDNKLKSGKNIDEICDALKPLITIYKENAQKRIKTQNDQILNSGIYAVSRKAESVLDDKRLFNKKLMRPTYLNLKGRSHSVSPERFQNGDFKPRGSSSSLPDLMKEENANVNTDSVSDAIVNGRPVEKGEGKDEIMISAEDIQSVSEICDAIKKSGELSNNLVFNLFDNILALGPHDSLENVRPLSLRTYFKEDEIVLISDLFHSSLNSRLLFEWLFKFNGDWLTETVKNYPAILIANHSKESLQLDLKLSKVLKLFSSVLNEKQIIEIIRETKIECYYFCLMEVLKVYQETSLTSVSDSTLNLAKISSAPKLLNVVYFLITVGQMVQCSKYSQKININEMFYLMLKFQESLKQSGKSVEIVELQCHTLFLTYLDKSSKENRIIDGVVENYVINCLENINSTAGCVTESNCSCGFPYFVLPASIAMFPDIGYSLIRKTWPNNKSKCIEICGRVPYLWKYLIYLRRSESLGSVLPLILQLGEIKELENRSEEVDERILESSVEYLIKLKNGNCLNCDKKIKSDGETVSWSDFGLLCIKLLGPEETLELFSKYSQDISSKELSQSFFQGLIFSSIMEKHNKGLCKNVVNLLAGKGTQESSRISPFSDDIKKKLLGDNCDNYDFQKPEPVSHHWGVKMNFKENCLVCSLPLDTRVLISEAGLIVFKCSHAFHSACLRRVNIECPVCKEKSSKEPNKDGDENIGSE